MSTKNKPLPYIDAATTSNTPPPVVRKVKFNPYTGGVLSNNSDRPAFGKYTMEIRSGTGYRSKYVNFKKKLESPGKWSILRTQIPVPDIKLFVKNPNYDILDVLVYLALDESALAGVDNGGNFEVISRQAANTDLYISFSPDPSTVIRKSTVTLALYDEIVRLFEKYTIYNLLELMTGKSYSEEDDDDVLISLLRSNFHNLNLYAEAGFNNDSNSTKDGYFIRNKLVTRLTFDPDYLDNPSLKKIVLRPTSSAVNVDVECANLQSITFNLYAGPDTNFDYTTSDELIKTYTVNVEGDRNPTISIPLSDIKVPDFNGLDSFLTEDQVNAILYKRKCISVKVTAVKVAYGTTKLEKDFNTFFGINASTDTTKTVSFSSNVPAPLNMTFFENLPTGRPPYFLDLVSNSRKFYLRVDLPATAAPYPDSPANYLGFLIKYNVTVSNATRALRFFSFDSSFVTRVTPPLVPKGSDKLNYYYEISDPFVLPASAQTSFRLDIPYASTYEIFLVDNFYNISSAPLNVSQGSPYDIQNYFTPGNTAAFIMQTTFNLQPENNFIKGTTRLSLQFTAEYTPRKVGETAPSGTAKWTALNGGMKYRYLYKHTYENIQNSKAGGITLLDSTNKVLTGIDCSSIFKSALKGQGYWIRLVLSPSYTTTKTLPYVNSVLGIFSKFK
jgi:hypothetical protein